MNTLSKHITDAQNILLSTHRQSDGDGLGSQIALYYALKKLGKNVRILNVDRTPRKYRFLNPSAIMQYYEEEHDLIEEIDLALILDTNDCRIVEPLYSALTPKCDKIIFIDHHPVLKQGPSPTEGSYIDTKAASTGEIAYSLIKELNIPLDTEIATALYTSIVFDTQLFRYIRNSPRSHEIAAELLGHGIDPQNIHRHLFADQTVEKMTYLAKALNDVEYFEDNQIAILKMRDSDLLEHKIRLDEARDLIDMIMNIESLELAVIFREDQSNEYKISLRSKGKVTVLELAEKLGGGGHYYAAGAYITGEYKTLKERMLADMRELLNTPHSSSGPDGE